MTHSEEIRFRAGDRELAGTLSLPSGEGRRPWALLVPSWLPRDRDGGWDRRAHASWFGPGGTGERPGLLARLADSLAGRGVASVRYDPAGCGDSGGRWEETDLFARIDDARDAIGAMRSRRELDLRRTAIVGHGEGATIALSVAIGDPAIGAVGLVGASARSFRDVLLRGVAERARTGGDREHPVVAALDRVADELLERVARRERSATVAIGNERVRMDLSGWEQATHTPPLALATMLHRSIVLAHGMLDAWADPDESRLLASVLAESGNDPVLQLVEGVGHDLTGADDAVEAFADALVRRMTPRDLPPVLVAMEEMG